MGFWFGFGLYYSVLSVLWCEGPVFLYFTWGPSFLRIVCLGDYCKSMAPSFPFSLLFSFLVAVKQHILLSHACIALLLMSISKHILLVVHFFTGLCSHSCVWLHVGWTFAHTYIPHTYPLIFLFILLLFPYTDWRAHFM
jgi:hypothetical protein